MALNKTILSRDVTSTSAPEVSGSLATTWTMIEVRTPFARIDAATASAAVYVATRRSFETDLTAGGTPSNAAMLPQGAVEAFGNPHPGVYPWYLFVAGASGTPSITVQAST